MVPNATLNDPTADKRKPMHYTRQTVYNFVSYTHMPKEFLLLAGNKAFSDPIWLFLHSLPTLKKSLSLNWCLEIERHYVLLA